MWSRRRSPAIREKLPQVDIDVLRLMLRALLADRFKLVTHMEDRPVAAYVLSAVKPKLQKADPSNRTGCKEGPGPDGKGPQDCESHTVAAAYLPEHDHGAICGAASDSCAGYVHTAVLDSTGLEGAWDFTLNFSAIGLLQAGGAPGQPPSGAPGASDPNGALSLPDAVNKQLGLKLELQKRPMPVLVIDHVEEKPTDN